MDKLVPIITQINPIDFEIIFESFAPEGTEFSIIFDPQGGYDSWEVEPIEFTDWQIEPYKWAGSGYDGDGNLVKIENFHFLNYLLHLEFEKTHVMRVGKNSQLKLRAKKILLKPSK